MISVLFEVLNNKKLSAADIMFRGYAGGSAAGLGAAGLTAMSTDSINPFHAFLAGKALGLGTAGAYLAGRKIKEKLGKKN